MIENNIVKPPKKMESKNVILTKRFKHAIYALAVRTTAQMVYMDDTYKYTLTEMINDIVSAIATSSERITINSERLDKILKDAPEEMQTFIDVWHYINVEGDSPLAEAINNRYTKGEVDDLLSNMMEEIEAELEEIRQTPNAKVIPKEDEPVGVKDGDIFYHIEDDEIDGIDDPTPRIIPVGGPIEGDMVPDGE